MYQHPLYHWPPRARWVAPVTAPQDWQSFSAYLHFPFCRYICDFCNYETRLITNRAAASFSAHAVEEIARYGERDDFRNGLVTSLFFGGGTASLMPVPAITGSIEAIKRLTGQAEVSEITLECEPGTINTRRLEELRGAGVNRLGVCAQSFDDGELKRLTRHHSGEDSLRLIDNALQAGISNVHVDLIYGLRGQTIDDWRRTVAFVVSLPITHISMYKLYVFKYGALDRAQVLPRPEEETEALTAAVRDMYEVAARVFEEHGFEQYTLTEFARPGYKCDYLQQTFGGGDVLPLGPSSFGRRGASVWENGSYVNHYGDADAWDEQRRGLVMSPPEQFKRDVVLGLWLLSVDVRATALPLGLDPSPRLTALFAELEAERLLSVDGDRIWLSREQRFRAGSVMSLLAGMGASEWAQLPFTLDTADGGAYEVDVSPEMRSLFRVLRNDPRFFVEMARLPEGTLARVGLDLSADEADALRSAVRGDGGTDSPLVRHLRHEWTSVGKEHHRLPGGLARPTHDDHR